MAARDRAFEATGGHTAALIAGKVALYGVLLFFSALFIMPLLWMISTSLKEVTEAMRYPPTWIPEKVRWQNYREVTRAIPFWAYAANTLTLCALNVAGTVLSSACVAYGFSRIKWPGRDRYFALTLATMMIPFPVLMVPLYAMFKSLGWIGTFMPLWVPSFFGAAYNIFLLRQFFMTIPHDLSEAAIDRRLRRVPHLLADDAAAGAPRADGGRIVLLHGRVERLPRPADLPDRRQPVHPRAGPAAVPEPPRRHRHATC